MRAGKQWTTKELHDLRHLHGTGMTYEALAERFGRSVSAIKAQLQHFTVGGNRLRERRARENARRRDMYGRGVKINSHPHRGVRPDLDAVEEMYKRRQLEPRSGTAAIMGDPLPGYSALDKR
jgi:hypothetical protein